MNQWLRVTYMYDESQVSASDKVYVYFTADNLWSVEDIKHSEKGIAL